MECSCEWILLQHVMLGQELDRPETWDKSSGTFQSKNNKTNRVQKKKHLLYSLKTKCFSFIRPHSLIELQITLHILHVYKIHCMYCRLHMCSPVLRHITYIPHRIKLFFLHILKHFSTYKGCHYQTTKKKPKNISAKFRML